MGLESHIKSIRRINRGDNGGEVHSPLRKRKQRCKMGVAFLGVILRDVDDSDRGSGSIHRIQAGLSVSSSAIGGVESKLEKIRRSGAVRLREVVVVFGKLRLGGYTDSTSALWMLMATDFMICSTLMIKRREFCFSNRVPSQPAKGPCLTRTRRPILR